MVRIVQKHVGKVFVPLGDTAGQGSKDLQEPTADFPVPGRQLLCQALRVPLAQGGADGIHVLLLLVHAQGRVIWAKIEEAIHAHGGDQVHVPVSGHEPGQGQDHLLPERVLLRLGEVCLPGNGQIHVFRQIDRQPAPAMEEPPVLPPEEDRAAKTEGVVAGDEAIQIVQPRLGHLRGVGEPQHVLFVEDVVPADVLPVVGGVHKARLCRILHPIEGQQGQELLPAGMSQGL